jgi:hypothetical protein
MSMKFICLSLFLATTSALGGHLLRPHQIQLSGHDLFVRFVNTTDQKIYGIQVPTTINAQTLPGKLFVHTASGWRMKQPLRPGDEGALVVHLNPTQRKLLGQQCQPLVLQANLRAMVLPEQEAGFFRLQGKGLVRDEAFASDCRHRKTSI